MSVIMEISNNVHYNQEQRPSLSEKISGNGLFSRNG